MKPDHPRRYMDNAAYRPDNSHLTDCNEEDILVCRTDSGNNDR
jgi:hypothetical protein